MRARPQRAPAATPGGPPPQTDWMKSSTGRTDAGLAGAGLAACGVGLGGPLPELRRLLASPFPELRRPLSRGVRGLISQLELGRGSRTSILISPSLATSRSTLSMVGRKRPLIEQMVSPTLRPARAAGLLGKTLVTTGAATHTSFMPACPSAFLLIASCCPPCACTTNRPFTSPNDLTSASSVLIGFPLTARTMSPVCIPAF
mmetsp:Transcript_25344/g.50954  ORF Transcript_25344/g.50954 Transcript_25344/m.50954 type:complete len:202 (-) Transcript_25344:317-922(-)